MDAKGSGPISTTHANGSGRALIAAPEAMTGPSVTTPASFTAIRNTQGNDTCWVAFVPDVV